MGGLFSWLCRILETLPPTLDQLDVAVGADVVQLGYHLWPDRLRVHRLQLDGSPVSCTHRIPFVSLPPRLDTLHVIVDHPDVRTLCMAVAVIVGGLRWLELDCRMVKGPCNVFYTLHWLRQVRHLRIIAPLNGAGCQPDLVACQLFVPSTNIHSLCLDVRHCSPPVASLSHANVHPIITSQHTCDQWYASDRLIGNPDCPKQMHVTILTR